MEQASLFDDDNDPPYQRHSETSREAAREIEGTAATLRRKLLAWLVGRGPDGATDEEAQLALDMNPSTQRPRRIELEAMGLVWDSGRTRLTRSRRNAVVWVAAGSCVRAATPAIKREEKTKDEQI